MDENIENEYFEWLYGIVCKSSKKSYKRLIDYLHQVDFTYTVLLDENRERDGIDLRYRFGYEKDYSINTIFELLGGYPCSILEMMIALAIRCEENIMDDPDVGDRTGQWFWCMVESLGLDEMTDSRFDRDYVDDVVSIFLSRDYGRNGEGGLFTVNHARGDMRKIEIWYQMCWYLDELLDY